MILRNGISSNIRARGRTALFFALITALTFSLVLSIGVASYSRSVISRCDEVYRTIGFFEYMGADYPDENAADIAARSAYDLVCGQLDGLPDGAVRWSPYHSDIVFANGFSANSSSGVYADRGVVIFGNVGDPVYNEVYEFVPIEDVPRTLWGYKGGFEIEYPDYGSPQIITENGDVYSLAGYNYEYDDDSYVSGSYHSITGVYVRKEDKSSVAYYYARISEVLYAADFTSEMFVNLLPDGLDFTPESGKTYIAHGVFISKNEGGPRNGLISFDIRGIENYDGAPFAEYDGAVVPEAFSAVADKYKMINNSVTLESAADINDLYEFNQGLVYADKGEVPSPDDVGACVISSDIAYRMKLSIGDEFTVALLSPDADSRSVIETTEREKTLRVAAVANASTDFGRRIWAVGEGFGSPLFGYRIGSLRLENAEAAETADALTAQLPEGVRLTVFDQGYSDAVSPLQTVIATAANVAAVCSVGAIAVMLLFSFLFVGRQGGNVRIMVSLGTPRAKIVAWLLSGAVLITAAASAAGAIAGHFALPAVYSAVTQAAYGAASAPLYSETALGVRKSVELSAGHSVLPTLLVWAGMMLISLLFCLIFMRRAIRAGTFDRGNSRVRIPGGATSVKGRGSLRFAALSIKRGGTRSLIVPAVAAVLTVIVVFLAGVFQSWIGELHGAYEDMRVSGNAVSTNGQYYSNLVIPPDNVRALLKLENVTDVSVSKSYKYWLPDEIPAFGGSSFSQESRSDWISAQPEITAVNRLDGAKEFFYSDPSVKWLDGWDESFLANADHECFLSRIHSKPTLTETGELVFPQSDPIPAVIGDSFAEAHGLSLGDELSIYFREVGYSSYGSELTEALRVVGIYNQGENKAQIYVPLAWTVPLDALFGEYNLAEHDLNPETYYNFYYYGGYSYEQYLDNYFYTKITFATCRFAVSSANWLDAAREELKEAGFSRVGKLGQIRTTLLFHDGAFVRFTETLGRYITTGKVMMAVIAALISACGFVISWLLINGRKQEFAMMRGFGVRKRQIFASFFLEQAFLCGAGTLVGCVSLLFFGAGGWLQPAAAAAFAAFYLAGCAVSVKLIGRMKLMELLAAKE